jgi:geranylgeranyl diphosphate synthase type I
MSLIVEPKAGAYLAQAEPCPANRHESAKNAAFRGAWRLTAPTHGRNPLPLMARHARKRPSRNKAPARAPAPHSKKPRAKKPRSGKLAPKKLHGNPFLALLHTLKPEVNARLAGFLDAKLDAATRRAPSLRDVLHELVSLCQRGGKRTRPALVVVGQMATRDEEGSGGNQSWERALDVGVALELLHAYFLIHDDWMDRDEVRRGAPTVHTALTHRLGSPHLGAAVAVLAGDYAAGLALEALCRVDTSPDTLSRLMLCFADMQQAAVLGQQLDVLAAQDTVETTYQLKTASYSVQGPLLMGAHLAGANNEICQALERLAIPTGIAFQMRDDLLNAFGDPEITGKPVGSDIQEGKRTLLAQLALRALSGKEKKDFLAAYGNAKATKKQLARAVALLESSGARAVTEQRLQSLLQQAQRTIDAAPFRPKGKQLLHGAVDYLIRREQ